MIMADDSNRDFGRIAAIEQRAYLQRQKIFSSASPSSGCSADRSCVLRVCALRGSGASNSRVVE